MSESKKHYSLAPSAAHRWMVCSGEPRLRASVPNVSSEYAELGTTAHWAAAQCLLKGKDPRDYAGQRCPETGLVFTADMVNPVRIYVNFCREQFGEWHVVEGKFKLSEKLGGTTDFASITGKVLQVVDYKNGEGYEVKVERNPQVLIYALGALSLRSAQKPRSLKDISSVRYGIVQPRLDDGEPIKLESMLLSELLEWKEKELVPAIKRVETEPDKLVAGDHCRFCPAKAVCPAQYQKNLEVAQVDFSGPVAAAPPMAASLTIDQLARVLRAKEQIESWLGSIEEYAQSVLQQGQAVPGFKLVKKRSTRAWVNESQAESALVSALGQSAYAPRKLLSPAQAEEVLEVLGTKLNGELVCKPDKGCVIAPVSDKRPAVAALPAAQQFLQDADFLN